MDIPEFQGEYRWLSNFWPARVTLDGCVYPSVENAYQAAKAVTAVERAPFGQCTAAQAKRLGRTISIRSDWDASRVAVMRDLLEQKFAPDTGLAEQLMATGDGNIVEGNHWGDTFWGYVAAREPMFSANCSWSGGPSCCELSGRNSS